MTTSDVTSQQRRVTFPELVRLHFHWRRSLRDDSTATPADLEAIDTEYHTALARFEEEHGEIVSAYWCSDVESAVALTAGKPRTGWLRRLLSVSPTFHRVSDWATKDDPEVARLLHECDELAIRASEVLRGRSRRICIQLVMTSACHLLSLVDARGLHTSAHAHRTAVAAERLGLDAVAADYRQAANGDAQLVYFGGMVVGIGFLSLLYVVGGSVIQGRDVMHSTIVGCLVAGALGAVVSVIARINSGTFALDFDIARGYTLFLGALRPVIGSVFGLLSFFMLTSKFVQFFDVPDPGKIERFYFLCVIAFAAGFSERWAQDTLTGGLTGRGQGKDAAIKAGQAATDKRKPASPSADAPPADL